MKNRERWMSLALRNATRQDVMAAIWDTATQLIHERIPRHEHPEPEELIPHIYDTAARIWKHPEPDEEFSVIDFLVEEERKQHGQRRYTPEIRAKHLEWFAAASESVTFND